MYRSVEYQMLHSPCPHSIKFSMVQASGRASDASVAAITLLMSCTPSSCLSCSPTCPRQQKTAASTTGTAVSGLACLPQLRTIRRYFAGQASRRPMRLLPTPAGMLGRRPIRQLDASSHQPPPRWRRDAPTAGPLGSVSVSLASAVQFIHTQPSGPLSKHHSQTLPCMS